MSAESEVRQRGHNCAQIHKINIQFLDIHHVLCRPVRHLLPIMLLQFNL